MTQEQGPRRVRVVEAHVSVDPDPIRFRVGDTLNVGHHDQIWTEYVWGTDQAGRSGWVPESYMHVSPDGRTATAVRDYDSTELTVGRREILEVIEDVGGWYLCRSQAGLSGWVPSTAVVPA